LLPNGKHLSKKQSTSGGRDFIQSRRIGGLSIDHVITIDGPLELQNSLSRQSRLSLAEVFKSKHVLTEFKRWLQQINSNVNVGSERLSVKLTSFPESSTQIENWISHAELFP
jgi:hypothetical protein